MYAPVVLPPASKFMTPIGFILTFVGLGLGYYAFTMDVSTYGDVVSFQLLARQVCLAFFATGLFIGGLVMIGCAQVAEETRGNS